MKSFLIGVQMLLMAASVNAQIPTPVSSAEILQQMQRLKVLGSVLYIAAHPDDENTRLIAWLSNYQHYRTGYLSLTRGDGGQNLIGDEQGIELGLIRTQELLAARRIDGGQQFFTRAFDFGYSKSAQETFQKWNHDQILADAVWIVRMFQPDVIIARFPEDARAGHGHHSASGIIAREVFAAAADSTRFPNQLKLGVKPWQAKRMLWNTFNFGGGSSTIDSTQLKIEVGQYSPLLGRSMGELAGESRSQHKSQGFGVSRQRGAVQEFFVTLQGETPDSALLDGVVTNWNRLPGGAAIEAQIDGMIARYNMLNPAASIPALQAIIAKVQSLSVSAWRQTKMDELQKLVLQCAGIYAEATVAKPEIVNGDSIKIAINIINRSNVPVWLEQVQAGQVVMEDDQKLLPNKLLSKTMLATFGGSIMETQPYWLRQQQRDGQFQISDQQWVSLAENIPPMMRFKLRIENMTVNLDQPIRYRFVDPVKAEQYQPVYFTERFLQFNNPAILLFRKDHPDSAVLELNITSPTPAAANQPAVLLKSEASAFAKTTTLKPVKWNGGDLFSVVQKIPNYLRHSGKETDWLSFSFLPEASDTGKQYFNTRRSIAYDHIPTQTWHYRDRVKVLHLDLKTVGKKIGYLPGAGDKVAPMLMQMGYAVTELKPEDLTATHLKQFDAVITGIRAYNVHEYLGSTYEPLMQYVKNGGNLIVQYNTSNFISQVKGKIAPYNFSIGRTRVTDENSPVQFLLPNHPALNFPNKITSKDFEGWVQERSIYHAEGLDAKLWQMPVGLSDPGEQEQNGSLAIAPYGKGNFVYTGLVFFRQLPAGVPGAFRLMANLIALPGH